MPFTWGNIKTRVSVDGYTNENQILRHPESALGTAFNGVLDEANDVTRNLHLQTLVNLNRRKLWGDVNVSGLVGNQIFDFKSTVAAMAGQDFLDPNFVSMNNTRLRSTRTSINQRRLVGLFGSATFDYRQFLYVTVQGRNDRTSTIPQERNSFFYPSISSSFVFSEAFPSLGIRGNS